MTTEPVTLEQKDILHILRNPHGKTDDEKKRARLEGADEIEMLQRSYERAHAQAMENGTRALQAVHERDCAVESLSAAEKLLRKYLDREFNPFEPNNQSATYKELSAFLYPTSPADVGGSSGG